MVRLSILLAAGGLAVVGFACGTKTETAQTPEQQSGPPMAAQTETAVTSQPTTPQGPIFHGSAAGIVWTVPPTWQLQGGRPMRIATYAIPAVQGDPEAGECAVFFFGSGQGGNVELNVARWRDQFESTDGKSAELNMTASTINGFKIHTVSVTGTYLASMGPMFENGQAKKPGYKMVGAIIEAPEGNVFIKFIGPEKTVTNEDGVFKELLNSVKKGEGQSM